MACPIDGQIAYPLTLSVSEAAELTGLSEATIRRWEKDGTLPRIELSAGRGKTTTRRLRFRRQDVLALVGVSE